MLMVQQYHSIHEIDPEFIPSIETLLEEEIPHFNVLIKKHDSAPEKEMFTYYLFFGPTHNLPVGFSHIALKFLDKDYRPFAQKFKFWNKNHKHWKQFDWSSNGTSIGLGVFHQRAGVSSGKKMGEILDKYTSREDIVAFNIFHLKNSQQGFTHREPKHYFQKDHYHLAPLIKSVNTYQDYLMSLEPESQKEIKRNWMELHKTHQIELGEFQSLDLAPPLPFSVEQKEYWASMNVQVLTFNKETSILGCILMFEGKNGNFFFDPHPFEGADEALVSDILYIQYAILKFFEFSHSRKCHIVKNLDKLVFQDKEDLAFFADQGFSYKHIIQDFSSLITKLDKPS